MRERWMREVDERGVDERGVDERGVDGEVKGGRRRREEEGGADSSYVGGCGPLLTNVLGCVSIATAAGLRAVAVRLPAVQDVLQGPVC